MRKYLSIVMIMAVFTVQTGNAGNEQPRQRTWAQWAQQEESSATQALRQVPGVGSLVQDASMLMAKAREVIDMGREATRLAAQIQELMQRAEANLTEIENVTQKWGVHL